MMTSNFAQDLYVKAYKFAATAHKDQRVPGTELPYIMHISFVAMEVIAAMQMHSDLNGNLLVQCALLHDTLEDTDTNYDQLVDKFGNSVADGVAALTKDPSISADISTKEHRKKLQMADSLKRILEQPREIWMVKMADRITNLQQPPGHWTQGKIRRYREEAVEIYEALRDGSQYLSNRLKEKIKGYPF